MTILCFFQSLSLTHRHMHTQITYYIKLGNKKNFVTLNPFGTLPGSLSNDYSYS